MVKSKRSITAYDRLKAEILTGQLPPGYQASEPEISEHLEMSRTPVREALIRLEAGGLVGLVPRRGVMVLPMRPKDLTDICGILSVLEAFAAETAAAQETREGSLGDIEQLLELSDEALAKADMDVFAALDDRFHRRIAGLSGIRRLEVQIGAFLDQVYRANSVLQRLHGKPAASPEEHRELVELILSGKAQQAADLAKRHRLSCQKTLLRILKKSSMSEV